MMRFFSWNVRGFNNRIKRRKFMDWIKEVKPLFGCISETRITSENFDSVAKEFPDWKVISNYEHAQLGRIWVFWGDAVDLQVISKSSQNITCLIKLNNRSSLVVSFVYASNCRYERQILWEELRRISSGLITPSTPWAVIGDFNQTMFPQESSIGSSRITTSMREFRDCVHDTEVADLHYQGPIFTWWNNQEQNPIAKKLDRALVNDEWRLSFPLSYCTFDSMEFSDHTPILVSLGRESRAKTAFKFSNHLMDHTEFLETVSHFWDSTHMSGTSMFTLAKKLKLLKPVLKSFNSRHFSDLEVKVKEVGNLLKRSQAAFIANPCSQNAMAQKQLQAKWWSLAAAEEKFLKQRARVKWLQNGDRNTAYFHRAIQGRRATNRIHYLMANGVRLEEKKDLEAHCVSYFSNLLGLELPTYDADDLDNIKRFTRFRCDPSFKEMLQADITEEEIVSVLFTMPRNKCPGPDGFNVEFFVKCWPVLGGDFVRAVQEFSHSGKILRQLNATSIALIPKMAGAHSLKDFRPISLCNVVYKVISKIITRRLQLVLPGIISSNQSAFVKGRLLVENVTLATELVKGFGNRTSISRGALKVDLSKAFDSIRWDFILSILEAAEFPTRFVGWIRECLSTTSFSVSLNGELCGYFAGKRGLRQGDPLSPSLFIIAMEVFGEMLKSSFEDGSISYHSLCRSPKITHLSFADDVMIFFNGKPESLTGITNVFQLFKTLSGLALNMNKTMLFTTGLSLTEEAEVLRQGYMTGTLPVRYLGLPLLSRRMRFSDYSPLIDCIMKRLTSWTVRSLSFAGRLLLIRSVIYSVTNFWMGAFLLPKGCLRAITRLCSKFLWSGDLTRKAIHKVSWSDLCLPKAEGGLGLRDLSSLNAVLVMKLIWLIFSKESSLWVAWIKGHWLKRNNFWTAPTTSSGSWIWRSLLSLRPLAKRMISCSVGNGHKASFWHDSWLPSGPLINITGEEGPMRFGIHTNSSVVNAVAGNHWRMPQPRTRCPAAAELRATLVTARTPQHPNVIDKYFWGEGSTRSEHFSTKKTWEAFRTRAATKSWARVVWFRTALPKHSFLTWVITLDRLPLKNRLADWGISHNATCCICGSFDEDRDHLFLHCEFALQVWKWLDRKLQESCSFSSWSVFLNWLAARGSQSKRIIRIISGQAVVYSIWKERNDRFHNSGSSTTASTISKVDKIVRESLLATLGKRNHKRLLSLWFRFS